MNPCRRKYQIWWTASLVRLPMTPGSRMAGLAPLMVSQRCEAFLCTWLLLTLVLNTRLGYPRWHGFLQGIWCSLPTCIFLIPLSLFCWCREESKNSQREGVLITACCPGWCATDMAGKCLCLYISIEGADCCIQDPRPLVQRTKELRCWYGWPPCLRKKQRESRASSL